ncbi:SDR family oxidoreductase [Sediminicola sp. 1XM1-17]|uniref:SDR family oxidoreductase n=1 Tax=Sediminicola sp. 1XM1-17 TaxID=3127702 RepID=UPI00307758EE
MNSTVAIMGCGWLGTPLAQDLLQQGFTVHGSTTSHDKVGALRDLGIVPFQISLTENGIAGPITSFLENAKVIIINVPPNLRGVNKENYEQKIGHLHEAIRNSSVANIIFISSTSVYGDLDGDVKETSVPHPETDSGKQLLATEETLLNDPDLETTIIRFGGLIGPNRHPITFLAGKKGLSNGNHPINLIHLDDCIRIIATVLEKGYWGEIFNGVYPLHPPKKDYYANEADKRGLEAPQYTDSRSSQGKKVIPYNLMERKKFTFKKSIVS